MLNILPIMLLSIAQKLDHYAQYYAHEQWRIQHFKKGGSTPTHMHSQALPDSWAQQFS